uniref:Uncharacterized protein n=1 Tax=Myoviridae sp. ctshb19 TaxID=2825194 RepID=A0A8S5UGQ6_9CAUD|nr:MAG TPA: hypothetical protein [Myoviridae sp. ctshb19]
MAVGSKVYTSTDKVEWIPSDVNLAFSHIVYADKFYASVDGVGIYALDTDWTLVQEFDGNFVCARNVDGPAFGTDRGTILHGPNWQEISVGTGRVWLTDKAPGFRVVLHNGNLMETFSGPITALVSEGISDLDNLVVTGCWYDTKNSCTVVSAAFDGQPIFAVYKNGWTFNIVDLADSAVALADGALLTNNAIWTTSDWSRFELLHQFADFDAKTLLLA